MNDVTTLSWLVPLAAAAAILALYFLKTRRRPILVPSTLLWRRTIEDRRVNALWQRLRRSLFLVLQLAAIGAAAVALFRPSWQGSMLVGGRYVFVIDNSASMSAPDVAPSRLDEAKSRAMGLIDKMGSGDTAMVVSFAAHARVEQSFTDNRERLRRAVREIGATQQSTSLDEALRLCAGATPSAATEDGASSNSARSAKVFVFSDGNFPDVHDAALDRLPIVFVPIGTTKADNRAVTRLTVGRPMDSPRRAQALARIQNFGAAARETDVELFIEGKLVDARRLTLPATSKQEVVFTLDDAADGVWELRLDGTDELPVDDRAWAVLEPPTKARLLVVTPGNRFLKAALATGEAQTWCDATLVEPSFVQSEGYTAAATAGTYDAVVFDRCRPATMPACNTMFFAALPPQAGWRHDATVVAPQMFDVAQVHPLMQNVAMSEVLLAEGTPTFGPPGAQTLIDSTAGALAVASPRDGYDDVVFGFALIGADGTPQTNWPLVDGAGFEQFVLNTAQYFGRRGIKTDGEFVAPGAPVRLAIEATAGDVTVEMPAGRRVALEPTGSGERTFYETDVVGAYHVWQGDRLRRQFVVNLFDPRESSPATAPSPKLRVGREEINGQANWEAARWEGWKPFLLLVLALLGIEWYMYGKRGGL